MTQKCLNWNLFRDWLSESVMYRYLMHLLMPTVLVILDWLRKQNKIANNTTTTTTSKNIHMQNTKQKGKSQKTNPKKSWQEDKKQWQCCFRRNWKRPNKQTLLNLLALISFLWRVKEWAGKPERERERKRERDRGWEKKRERYTEI